MAPDGPPISDPDRLPLHDVRLVELCGRFGAYGGRLLADLGADVIRIVPPAGDPIDAEPPYLGAADGVGPSAVAAFVNAGKRTLRLDLGQTAGREVLDELLARSDAFLDGLDPGRAADTGLGPDAIATRHPHLVHVSVTAFGRSGPRSEWAADDLTALAAGGLLSLGGYPDAEPVAAYGSQATVAASIYAAIAILVGLLAGDEGDPVGQWIDVSAQEAIAAALEDAIPLYDLTGRVRTRAGARLREAGTGILACADGYVSMVAGRLGTARAWSALVAWLVESGVDGADVLQREAWGTLSHRQRPESVAFFAEVFARFAATRTKAELYEEAQRRSIALAPVNEIADVLEDPQLAYRRFFREARSPDVAGAFQMPGAPYRFDSAMSVARPTATAVDEGRRILADELGLSGERIDELAAAGVV